MASLSTCGISTLLAIVVSIWFSVLSLFFFFLVVSDEDIVKPHLVR